MFEDFSSLNKVTAAFYEGVRLFRKSVAIILIAIY